MRLARNAALWTLPFVLAPPIITVGQFGITLPEFLVVSAGFAILAFYERPPRGTPAFMVVYLLCFCLAWLGSLYNAYEWHIPVSIRNIVFLYTPLLAWLGFLVGRYSAWHLNEIVKSRISFVVILAVAIFAVSYPFLAPATRQLVMSPFIYEHFQARLLSPRFPGMGINANVYSFMIYVFLLFSLHAYFNGKASPVIPLAALAIVIAAAGKIMTAVSLASIVVLLVAAASQRRRAAFDRIRAAVTKRRVLLVAVVLVILTGAAITYGARAREAFTLYIRFQEMLSNNAEGSTLSARADVWSIGMERVKLSPILGIPRDLGRIDDSNPLYSYTPHNEFIYFWTIFGILGLTAHVYLIGRMVLANIRLRAELPWLLLYAGMVVQMTFDSVFSGPRAIAFFFIVIGLNVKYLSHRKAERMVRRRRALESAVA